MAETDIIKYTTTQQYYPSDEVLDKEFFGTKQVQNARKITSQPIAFIKQDQQSSFDEEDIQVKKQQKHQKTHFSPSIPKLASLDTVFPVTFVAEDPEDEKIDFSDSKADKLFHEAAEINRQGHYESANFSIKEMVRRQNLIHDLHEEKEKKLDELAERMKKSENLSWVAALLGLGTAGLTIFGIAFTIATAGAASPILMALQAAATAVNGAVTAANQIQEIEAKKLQGAIDEVRQRLELDHGKNDNDSHRRQTTHNLLRVLDEFEIQVAKNRNNVRMN